MREFRLIREKRVLVVDDNLIGTRPEHVARAKDLFRAMAQANLRKEWVAQATINFADDEELLTLAAEAGCRGVFIGFESPTPEGLRELGKKFDLLRGRDFRASVRRGMHARRTRAHSEGEGNEQWRTKFQTSDVISTTENSSRLFE